MQMYINYEFEAGAEQEHEIFDLQVSFDADGGIDEITHADTGKRVGADFEGMLSGADYARIHDAYNFLDPWDFFDDGTHDFHAD